MTRLEEEHSNLPDVENLHEARKELQVKITDNKRIIQGFQVSAPLTLVIHAHVSDSLI